MSATRPAHRSPDAAVHARVIGRERLELPTLPTVQAVRVDITTQLRARFSRDGSVSPVDVTVQRFWYARGLGIVRVQAGATPEAKLAVLAGLQSADGPVVMVGDGVNDAPVLARADASLAMGQGALVARAQADAVVTSSRLTDIVRARARARRAVAIVKQNLVMSAAYNATCIPLALVGWLPPWAAGLGMALSSLVVIVNAQRAAR